MPLDGDFKQIVKDIIVEHPEWYDEYEDVTAMHGHFYQVLTQAGELLAFFALFYWEGEIVLGCVYVFPMYRNLGIFKQIVKFAKKKTPKNSWLTIGAVATNELANKIYGKMFTFHHFEAKDNCNWYIIKYAK